MFRRALPQRFGGERCPTRYSTPGADNSRQPRGLRVLQAHRGDRQGRRTAAHAGELTRLSISVNRSRRAAHRSASLRTSLPQLPAPGNRCRQRVRGNTATPTAAEIPRPTIVGLPLDGNDPGIPILLAMSDDGPRCAPAPPGSSGAVLDRRSLRPARHPDRQAWILFGHVKGEWPHHSTRSANPLCSPPSWRSSATTTTAAVSTPVLATSPRRRERRARPVHPPGPPRRTRPRPN